PARSKPASRARALIRSAAAPASNSPAMRQSYAAAAIDCRAQRRTIQVRAASGRTMDIFDSVVAHGHERVLICSNPDAGLKAIIAIHSTVLGPGLGGARMWSYASTADALTDALRLSRGMTYKAAAAGLHLGGAKAV